MDISPQIAHIVTPVGPGVIQLTLWATNLPPLGAELRFPEDFPEALRQAMYDAIQALYAQYRETMAPPPAPTRVRTRATPAGRPRAPREE